VLIRPWRTGDETLACAAVPHLSTTSLSNRFLAGTGGRLPPAYVRHVAAGPRPTWDAYVAEGDGHLIGWAEFGRVNAASPEADLAVIVADPWHRQGIASAMIRALLPRCFATDDEPRGCATRRLGGVARLGADILPGNTAAAGLLRSLFGQHLHGEFSDGVVRYTISVDDLTDLDDRPTDTVALAAV
jgi:GNAT superfamily N-acetyltransferase